MATTTKKSSKANTKTAKAKTARSKSTAVKASKNVSTKVTVKPTPAKVSKSASNMLVKLYAISAAVYVAVAGAAYALMSNVSYQLTVGYWGKDELISTDKTVFAPATQGVYDVELRWVVIAVMAISAIVPLLYLTRLKKQQAIGVKARVMPLRWIEMAITSAIMVETAALISGIHDIGTLKLVGGLMMVTCVLGWMAERRTAVAGKPATAKYYLSAVTGFLPWVVIGLYAVATPMYGGIRSPWFVYAIYGTLLLSAALFSTIQMNSMKALGKWKNYEVSEQNYIIVSLATRVAFAVILITGLMAK